MNLEWTSKLFWPSLLGAGAGIVVTAAASLGQELTRPFFAPLEIGLGTFAVFLFVVLLFDRQTRGAVDAYNLSMRNSRSLRWTERLFPPDIDRRLMATAYAAWLEIAAIVLWGDPRLAVLPFICFAALSLTGMFMLKQNPRFKNANPEPKLQVHRGWNFWIGGED